MMNTKYLNNPKIQVKEIRLYPKNVAANNKREETQVIPLNDRAAYQQSTRRASDQAFQQAPSYSNLHLVVDRKHQSFADKVKEAILANLDNELYGIEQLCRDLGVSRTTLHHKVKKYTNLSASIFIRAIRLEKAKELLLFTELNITQVGFEVGFADPAYFSRLFSQTFHQSPRDFRRSMGI